jgi:hypothetical protein
VSGKNSSFHSNQTGKDQRSSSGTLSLKKSKNQIQVAAVDTMNHVNDKENPNNEVEEMDTQEGKKFRIPQNHGWKGSLFFWRRSEHHFLYFVNPNEH